MAAGSAINMEVEDAVYYYFGSNSKDACAPAAGADNIASIDFPLQSIFLGY